MLQGQDTAGAKEGAAYFFVVHTHALWRCLEGTGMNKALPEEDIA